MQRILSNESVKKLNEAGIFLEKYDVIGLLEALPACIETKHKYFISLVIEKDDVNKYRVSYQDIYDDCSQRNWRGELTEALAQALLWVKENNH